MVEHYVRDVGAGGSNPLTSTTKRELATVLFLWSRLPSSPSVLEQNTVRDNSFARNYESGGGRRNRQQFSFCDRGYGVAQVLWNKTRCATIVSPETMKAEGESVTGNSSLFVIEATE